MISRRGSDVIEPPSYTKSIDLHLHSTASDGSYSPEELLSLAAACGLKTIAIADHDSVAGVRKATLLLSQYNLELIPAVELTAVFDGMLVDILGYLVDVDASWFIEYLEEIFSKRMTRAETMVSRLQQKGFGLSWDEVVAVSRGGFVCGVHILHVLYDKGFLKDEREIVTRLHEFFCREGPGYVPNNMEFRSAIEVIRMIHDLGGIAVLAHPGRYQREVNIREAVRIGLDGLEVYYSTHTPEMTLQYSKTARDLGMVATGGSDYHGIYTKGDVMLGRLEMPANTILQLSKCWIKRSKSKGFY
ncbi:MAG: PHP domain-containing protein [Symbiobacteriaceae bacterium]|nr:PHP domain-containing protein [Symbiobacteriaceae bacterium]